METPLATLFVWELAMRFNAGEASQGWNPAELDLVDRLNDAATRKGKR